MNITLIGMPGAGKSSVGRTVADRLGLLFIDIDRAMELVHHKPLQQILDEAGEEKFIRLETEAVLALGAVEGTLISPGGSIVYSPEAMEYLRSVSTVLFLEVPLEDIKQRIAVTGRGIVGGKDKTLEDIYAERLPLYKKYAQYVVPMRGSIEDNASQILQIVGK